jgi:hypothetical protein
MKSLICSILFVLMSSLCLSQELQIDTNKIAIIPFDAKNSWEVDRYGDACLMTQEDIDEVEKIFLQSIHEYDSSLTGINIKYFAVDLKDIDYYRRQYVCYKNKKGEKIVYVNCFCAAPEWWRTNLVEVDDGGKCYFSVKINLTTKKWFEFIPGGYA